MTLLITGGLGYIGSHVATEWLKQEQDLVLLDNLSTAEASNFASIQRRAPHAAVKFYNIDVRNKNDLTTLFRNHHFDAVIHLAGLKSVSESMQKPLEFFDNNLAGTLSLLQVMQQAGVKRIVFSSTAAVYGNPAQLPLLETAKSGTTANPYAESKHQTEQVLQQLSASDPAWSISILRYFNPLAISLPDLYFKSLPTQQGMSLMQNFMRCLAKQLPLPIYGHDYPTRDGSCIRDYIHIDDLAIAHLAAEKFTQQQQGVFIHNIGSGVGYSVIEIIDAFAKGLNKKVPYRIAPRRAGDLAEVYADISKAERDLAWRPQKTLETMIKDIIVALPADSRQHHTDASTTELP